MRREERRDDREGCRAAELARHRADLTVERFRHRVKQPRVSSPRRAGCLPANIDEVAEIGHSFGIEPRSRRGAARERFEESCQVGEAVGIRAGNEHIEDFGVVAPAAESQIARSDSCADCPLFVRHQRDLRMEDAAPDADRDDIVVPPNADCPCIRERRAVAFDVGEHGEPAVAACDRRKCDGL